MQVQNTAALVTGAASGLGSATATALAAQGVQVFGLDLAGGWEKGGDPAEGVTAVHGDVTSEDDVKAAVAQANEGASLRIVVNCAGLGWASRILSKKGVHDLGLFQKVVAVNLVGTFNVLRLAAEAIATNDTVDESGQRGVVVNTASVAAFDGQIGQIAYSASKGGVAGMTLPAARDLAQFGIRVMTIAPGVIDTPMMQGITEEFKKTLEASVPFPARLGTPAEYAQLVGMIVAHDYLNGEVIRMDGSLRMAPR
ncbi:SDR family NAD(P)-dependent oxidoreductase [Nakamurella sp. A5-74]|uniref:SDR family NAD(P)-dependent oxidoreductase n=1 Tax=Nakamurella sp. A5-74 TaxID=3158264 RepID=A0AAU8DMM4_9ACTN